MDERSRAADCAAQRGHGRAVDARPRLVFAVRRAARHARRSDEPRVAFEKESGVPQEINDLSRKKKQVTKRPRGVDYQLWVEKR